MFSRGNTRLQHDSALEHTKRDAHKAAFQMRLRAEGYDASERSEQSLTEVRQNKQCTLGVKNKSAIYLVGKYFGR